MQYNSPLGSLFRCLTLVLMVAAFAFAQMPGGVAPDGVFQQAYLAGGGGYSDTAHGFGWAAYAKKTGLFNGTTNFPTYSYSEVRTYRLPGSKNTTKQATDFTTGLLFPFYAKTIAGFDVALAVDGNIGVSDTGSNVGYVAGAKVVAKISKAGSPKWSLIVSADPNRSSVSGVHASQATFGVAYGFKGF